MDVKNMDFMGGSLQISTGVLARIARLAALEVAGVKDVRSATPEVKTLLSKNGFSHSVTVSMQEGVAEISVGLVVEYGHKIPAICAEVQENVKNAVQNMAGITVSKVNIIVVGVTSPSETEEK